MRNEEAVSRERPVVEEKIVTEPLTLRRAAMARRVDALFEPCLQTSCCGNSLLLIRHKFPGADHWLFWRKVMKASILFYTFLTMFVLTASVTLLGILQVVPIQRVHLSMLLSAFLIELAAAVVGLFKRTEFFTPKRTVPLRPL